MGNLSLRCPKPRPPFSCLYKSLAFPLPGVGALHSSYCNYINIILNLQQKFLEQSLNGSVVFTETFLPSDFSTFFFAFPSLSSSL